MHAFPPPPASPQAAKPKQQRKRGGDQNQDRRTASPQCFHLSRKAGLRARGIGSVAFPQALGLQWRRDRPALTYRCGGSTGLGAATHRTCFPFHPPAGSAGGHLERVTRCYTLSRERDIRLAAAGTSRAARERCATDRPRRQLAPRRASRAIEDPDNPDSGQRNKASYSSWKEL